MILRVTGASFFNYGATIACLLWPVPLWGWCSLHNELPHNKNSVMWHNAMQQCCSLASTRGKQGHSLSLQMMGSPARVMWDRDYAASVSVAEWWEDNCGGAPELQEFSSATSQHGINSSGVERVNSAIKNVIGNKRGRMGVQKQTKASKIFFNNRCFKKACKVGTSCEAYEAWDSSSSDED